MAFTYEFEQETDGRWIAEIPEVPGAIAYGITLEEAAAQAEAIALRTLGEFREVFDRWAELKRQLLEFKRVAEKCGKLKKLIESWLADEDPKGTESGSTTPGSWPPSSSRQ